MSLVDPLVGSVLDDKYMVERVLGAGAMGTVYRVRHIALGTIRAVKLMKPDLAKDASFADRFEREARLLEKVRHPHLVALYDFTRTAAGTCYIVSECVEGETLASRLEEGSRLPSEQIVSFFSQIADGLAAAHEVGVVHRDVSPDNIMVMTTSDGLQAKVVDFGLAKDVLRGSPGLTGAGLLLGKVGYASPEQMGLIADDESIDARSDVFSLAAVLYRVVCGALPWRNESLQAYLHDLIVRPEADLLRQIDADAPADWRVLFRHALARDRDVRSPSMKAFKDDLKCAASGTPVRLRPARTRPPGHGRTAFRAAAILLVVVAAVAFPLSRHQRPTPPAGVPPIAAATATIVVPTPTVAPPTTPKLALGPRLAPTEDVAAAARATTAPTSEPTLAPMPADGRLVLTASVEATVSVDGEERGHTPLSLVVSAGRHSVQMTSADGQTVDESIDVAPGAVVERQRRFSGFGALAVVSDPWVEVRVDDGEPEQTPVFIRRIAAGHHRITGQRSGYRPLAIEVDVARGQTHRLGLKPELEERSTTEHRSISETPTEGPTLR